ncbi:MAG TPA: zinc ribbon domain-containing protein [Clostridia bacterium]|nr:zinc ribbon domain-containing protein [Clostridia bacterium]
MAKFCIKCGAQIKDSDVFCPACGASARQWGTAPGAATPPVNPQQYQAPGPAMPLANAQQYQNPGAGNYPPPGQTYYAPPVQQAPPQQRPVSPPQSTYAYNAYNSAPPVRQQSKTGSKTGLIIAGIGVGVVALIAVIAIALSSGKDKPGANNPGDTTGGSLSNKTLADADLPDVTYSYLTREKSVEVDFTSSDTIYPNLYSTMDSVVNLTATSEGGDTDVLVRVEIPGFTQPYEQKVTLSSQITKLYIKPALLTGYIDLTSSKDAQISITVSDTDTGKIYAQETRKVKLMSVYDFCLWDDEFGAYSDYDLLAWLTPESEGILTLRRTAISWLENYTGGQLNSLPGYQLAFFGEEDYYLNVIYQVIGIQAAMSELGMRYNMGSFSMTEGANQRVLLPDESLSSGSGVCIETALVMASAIQSANMHAMIILPPGHAQVAIEDWNQSGDYWLIETTLLPFYGSDEEISSLITYFDASEWAAYLADPWGDGSGPCFVVDCDMATPLGVTGFSN